MSEIEERLGRYRAVLEDAETFFTALEASPPVAVWAPSSRLGREELARLLEEEGIGSEALAWHPQALRLPAGARPGRTWLHRAGLLHVQDPSSILAATLLAPRPGARVLDLCAAPGGKSALLSLAVGREGTLVANDRNPGRMAALRFLAERAGLLNLVTCVGDGSKFEDELPYDAVLVDAPCSSEGRLRAGQVRPLARGGAGLAERQFALLRRGFELLRPGGRVLYSTCTYRPEENEAVVARLLRRFGDEVELEDLAKESPEGLSEGLVGVIEGTEDPRLARCRRVWPHRFEGGGFFFARLRRHGERPAEDQEESGFPALAPEADEIRRHFGLPPECFAGLAQGPRSATRSWLVPERLRPPRGVETDSLGLCLASLRGAQAKLSTGFAQLIGGAANARVLDLTAEERDAYLRREPLPRPEGAPASGYVLLRHRGYALGLGLVRGGEIESLFPKAWALDQAGA